MRSRSRGGSSSGSSTKKRAPVSVGPRMEGEAYLGSYKVRFVVVGRFGSTIDQCGSKTLHRSTTLVF